MSAHAVEREIIARPSHRHASISRRQLGLAGAALLIGVGAAGYGHHWWTVGRFIESTDDAYVGGDVTVIAPKVAGFIADVAVTDNQAVHAGDLLVKLDDRDYRAALAKAVAAVAGQQATLANLDANRRLQEAVIAQAKAELTATSAEITRTGYDVDRYRSLAQDQFGSPGSGSSRRMPITRRRSPPMPGRARHWMRRSANSRSSTRRSSRPPPPWPAPSPTATPRSSTWTTPSFARRSTGRWAIAARARAPMPRWVRSSSRWYRRTDFGWTQTSRKASSRACMRGCR